MGSGLCRSRRRSGEAAALRGGVRPPLPRPGLGSAGRAPAGGRDPGPAGRPRCGAGGAVAEAEASPLRAVYGAGAAPAAAGALPRDQDRARGECIRIVRSLLVLG